MIKTVFFGTPDFALPFLRALHEDAEIDVITVVSQPDKKVGRKQILTAPPVKMYAQEQHIPILQPEHLRSSDIAKEIKMLQPDIFVVVAYGKLICKRLLDIPTKGVVNVHPSLLPKYRGPSPIQSAIIHQESKTGVSIMLLDELMDHGPILAQEPIALCETETTTTLTEKIFGVGIPLLINTIKSHVSGNSIARAQDDNQATYCKILTKADGEVHWRNTATEIKARFRALWPWPGMFTHWNRSGKNIHIQIHNLIHTDFSLEPGRVLVANGRLFVGTKTTAVELTEIQPEGKKRMQAKDFVLGHADIHHAMLSDSKA